MAFTKKRTLLSTLVLSFILGAFIQSVFAGPMIRQWDEDEEEWKDFPALRINYEAQLYGQYRDQGSGPEKEHGTTDFYFRRSRIIFRGLMTETIGFNTSFEFHGSKRINQMGFKVNDEPFELFTVLDAFLMADFTSYFKVRAGLTKDRLVRDHIQGCFFALGPDRSLFVYTPLPRASRDMGVVIWGNVFKNIFQYRLAAMKGHESSSDPASSAKFTDKLHGNLRYTSRFHVSLLSPESSEAYFGTYVGRKKVLTIGGGYQFELDAVYANKTAKTVPKDYQGVTADIFFEYPTKFGAITLAGTYLVVDFDNAYQGADPDPRSMNNLGEKNGWLAKFAYLLPGKIGPGKLQFFARYENFTFAKLLNVTNQEIKWTAGGINYFLRGHFLRLSLEYAMTDFVKDDLVKDYKDITLMLQLMF